MQPKLILKDGLEFEGRSFGAEKNISGEVVFATGMTGYVESLTDPSYAGQILVLTYPLIGNYGVQDKKTWESTKIQVSGLIVSSYIDTPSHYDSQKTLGQWLKEQKIPALEIKDTRFLAKHLATNGCVLGRIDFSDVGAGFQPAQKREGYKPCPTKEIPDQFYDPNEINLVNLVSRKKVERYGKGKKTILLLDCGVKQNIIRELVKRNVQVVVAPWDYDYHKKKLKFDGILISNGPGDPKMATATIQNVKKSLSQKKPILGICLGNQILALAAGGDTYKLKFGHRGQNQPAVVAGTKRCFLTTQNHGFAVGRIPKGFKQWFYNANDNTNEGIIHKSLPFMSVQFHPEACPGPTDTGWIFDEFIKKING